MQQPGHDGLPESRNAVGLGARREEGAPPRNDVQPVPPQLMGLALLYRAGKRPATAFSPFPGMKGNNCAPYSHTRSGNRQLFGRAVRNPPLTPENFEGNDPPARLMPPPRTPLFGKQCRSVAAHHRTGCAIELVA